MLGFDTLLAAGAPMPWEGETGAALSMVRHAELRGRDISSELGELTDIKDTSTQEVEQAKVDIVKLESQLIQTLSVKKLALEDPSTEK